MRFIPHTAAQVAAMLETIGVAHVTDLISHVPVGLRELADLKLDPGRSEAEVVSELHALAARNQGASEYTSFLGGGFNRHYIPAAVRAVASRAEFATSYTPYQAEASQGTTQAIFEFQTLITQLTAMDVANASMYDGASATAEAVLMARRLKPKRKTIAVSRALWPDYRDTIRTYLSALSGIEILELAFDNQTGTVDLGALTDMADEELLCVVLGYPNVFGVIEPLNTATEIAHRAGALVVSATAEALSLGLLKAPGELGADIVAGEGQSFGLAVEFGGPGVGFLAARTEHLRQMPGRLVGQTRDRDGRRAFCLTLATREQHIRRERATSNICTNHSLCALAATVYLSLMGRQGLRELAERNVELAYEAIDALEARGLRRRFSAPVFNEFALALPHPVNALAWAEQRRILAGIALQPHYAELGDSILISVTEMNRSAELHRLAEVLAEAR
jgi:glycine dehydrogenase subunit 1